MTRSPNKTLTRALAVRFLFTAVALALSTAGCEKAANETAAPAQPPSQFSDGGQQWRLHEGTPSNADNKSIGTFFKKNPNLIGSPDWTGDPQKYVCEFSSSLTRFYWFSGTNENATWNALEVKGGRCRQLNGSGLPSVE